MNHEHCHDCYDPATPTQFRVCVFMCAICNRGYCRLCKRNKKHPCLALGVEDYKQETDQLRRRISELETEINEQKLSYETEMVFLRQRIASLTENETPASSPTGVRSNATLENGSTKKTKKKSSRSLKDQRKAE
jgi:hypothetical protein